MGDVNDDRDGLETGTASRDPAALGSGLVADEAEVLMLDFGAAAGAHEESLVLTMEDLLPDDAGEVVLLADGDLPVNFLAGEGVTATGIAPEHVTAGGLDVTGLHYYSFESGITLYGPADLLIINDPNVDPNVI